MSSPVITIFVRHAISCKYAGDETTKRCNCRKHFRWTMNGKQHFKTAGTRSWAEAEDNKQRLIDQIAGRVTVAEKTGMSISEAARLFQLDKVTQGLEPSSIERYKTELARLQRYCDHNTAVMVKDIGMELLTGYRGTWADVYPSTATRSVVQKRLKSFLGFCVNAGWLDRMPKLSPIKIDEPETMPLTTDEYSRLLAAAPDAEVRAIIQLMRWSGLAVRDASTLKVGELLEGTDGTFKIVRTRTKTDTHLYIPIPDAVAAEVIKLQRGAVYYFDNGGKSEAAHAHNMSRKISAVFDNAGIVSLGNMVSHRLRDTFAVDLLEKGVSLDDVSKLLGHTSVTTTEKHYAKWVKGRQDRLDKIVTQSWSA